MPEVIQLVGISFDVYVHMWADVLKQLCFQGGLIFAAFTTFFGSCGNSVLLRSLFYRNLNRHSGILITSGSYVILFLKFSSHTSCKFINNRLM